jgi:hypothetical protein
MSGSEGTITSVEAFVSNAEPEHRRLAQAPLQANLDHQNFKSCRTTDFTDHPDTEEQIPDISAIRVIRGHAPLGFGFWDLGFRLLAASMV